MGKPELADAIIRFSNVQQLSLTVRLLFIDLPLERIKVYSQIDIYMSRQFGSAIKCLHLFRKDIIIDNKTEAICGTAIAVILRLQQQVVVNFVTHIVLGGWPVGHTFGN
jgi:hypothetical protein